MIKSRPAARAPRWTGDLVEFKTFLSTIDCEVNPTVHVNGSAYSSAIVTVDFGSPVNQFRLTSDDNAEVTERLRYLARVVVGREAASIRISNDGPNGIFWASLV